MINEVHLGEAISLEKAGWIKIWLDKTPGGGKRASKKQGTRVSSKKSKLNAGEDTDDEVSELERRLDNLKEKHPSVQLFKLRVWAKMLINGTHTSEDEPPDVSFFTGKKSGKSSSSGPGQDGTSANRKEPQTSNAENKLQIRGALMKQLKELKELKEEGILNEQQYSSQRDKLIKQLEEI
ncbi:hypothetical protein AC249_AIPGENE28340 [Exaiptasia diaphana]|nr:hypothetical protein AC249_AIPGENE28340 [Exaiptasia diaphana]